VLAYSDLCLDFNYSLLFVGAIFLYWIFVVELFIKFESCGNNAMWYHIFLVEEVDFDFVCAVDLSY
jgi:hypothetical protein